MTGNPAPRLVAALFACLVVNAACSSKDSAPATRTASTRPTGSRAKTNDSAAGSVDLGGGDYKPSTLTAIGGIKGTIRLDGTLPTDAVAPATAEKVCQTKGAPTAGSSKGGLGDAIVWIADAKTGKALPSEKRFEVSADNCVLDPRVQAMSVGSTVNVFNDDKALHKLVFIDATSGDTLQRMPFFNEGQVVASEVLAKASRIVEVRCAQHPWMRAFLAVFDHPYFAVTENDGTFKIDSLPPGKYTVNVWHEGLKKPVTQTVDVTAGGSASLDVAIKP